MRVSSIIPTLMAALLPIVAATEDCDLFTFGPIPNVPVGIALRCPSPFSLSPGEVYSEAAINANKCMANQHGELVPRKE
ncbi:uncharacterized protein N7459_002903 [Penicillium hispanicum]|uniref:uncharacterized protein n=1 Tax=Penicillium hispanicum TaxID=1080232 RepID=UPI002541C48A|nr:uncharacterized protein N7459_002903 [Penicillium hispanicum]KAJ5587138.1 hypothetical protein N7459_002903 [Penicillium hispanicum]